MTFPRPGRAPRPAHPTARRAVVTTWAIALAAVTAACGPSGAAPTAPTALPTALPATSTASTGGPSPSTPPTAEATDPPSTPSGIPTSSPTAEPTAVPTATPTATPTETEPPAPPKVVILQPGDTGPKVRSMQARLRQIGWFDGDVSDLYGPRTRAAIEGFQAKRGFEVTGVADEETYERLLSMTTRPTADELANVKPKPPEPEPVEISWDVDDRCLTGRVMCISKDTQKLTWVIDGKPQYQFSVRFGSEQLPTREGVFSVGRKKVEVISNLYHTPMPYSMFFSGGQAVHYSSNFARLGYNGSSHGCVNVRDWDGIVRLYNESLLGDKVVIHW